MWLTVILGNSANARQVGNPESGLSEGALLFILLCIAREGRLQQALEQAGSKSEEADGRQQVWGNNVSSGALALPPPPEWPWKEGGSSRCVGQRTVPGSIRWTGLWQHYNVIQEQLFMT